MAFLDDRYLLSSDTAVGLYESIRDLPIVDPHNHCDVKALCENANFGDLWEAEGATDHYVWECLRKRGVPERLITGTETSNEEKWLSLAGVFEDLAGNPTYEWVHLDLKRVLGIDDLIGPDTGAAVWRKSKEILAGPDAKPQALVRRMRVEAMCSTDDPVDSLEYHRRLRDSSIPGVVRPTFRPDKAMNIFKPDWRQYITRLEERVNGSFASVRDLVAALKVTHDFFAENGCVASDHGVTVPYGFNVDEADADAAFRKAMAGKPLDDTEVVGFMSYMLGEVAEMDAEKGWVFQLHLGAVRDIRDSLLDTVGADAGGDTSDHMTDVLTPLRDFLNRFDDRLDIVLYNLSPVHTATLAGMTRAFGARVNLGLAWWLNDSFIGMKRQLEYVGTVDVLMNLGGMVSDSRKILSYGSRHEMFRRALADTVGRMVDLGQMPRRPAEKVVRALAYERPKSLFKL